MIAFIHMAPSFQMLLVQHGLNEIMVEKQVKQCSCYLNNILRGSLHFVFSFMQPCEQGVGATRSQAQLLMATDDLEIMAEDSQKFF